MPSRPLSVTEEKKLVQRLRKGSARNRALILAQLFLGFRISEILALNVEHVCLQGKIRDRITLPPRFLKGHYGRTRSVPVVPELRRALSGYLEERSRSTGLKPCDPLFPSRNHGLGDLPKRLMRSAAEKLIKASLCGILKLDPHGLSSHSLRKTYATRVYTLTGHDLVSTRDALGHSSVAVTQVYLNANQSKIDEAVMRRDWTRVRRPAQSAEILGIARPTVQNRSTTSPLTLIETAADDNAGWLPGLVLTVA
ncbi:MAG: tyrosine-type recombinase/integrase [Opitutaceae bacterium]|nr:tyrosine-type recombinase/integrase [Opitutaceae bacterium]